ncbi:NAD(P)-dependent alcohol dehydrogenase [Microbacterium thalassium]|uniref:Aryl-alcohol dehydrogenase n=1 Tax=Microbacterium thalassium TaxID=362649 RepID=A0A7X0FNX3_9MICO|nr:NAD(P)-dependent alcohol dehydrogenase [Microbacterium thalassium]MBB6390505.1 aryl-alcohol dehydrogenase [Microbacterium thalassium]GLK25616.1 aryl-alcohol dehydrogenase [Microbacterium thalassium]
MSITTEAAVLREPDAPFALEQVTLSDLGPTSVLVRVVGAGFCHTDVMPRGLASYALPAVLGHEGAGVVVDAGSEVTDVAIGDAVVLTFAYCGVCAQCAGGTPSYCELFTGMNMTARNVDGTSGGTDAEQRDIGTRWFGQSSFARHAVVDQRSLVVVDADLPLELLGPLGCGIQTGAGTVLTAMGLQPGQSIAVFGAGAVGLAAIMAAKLAGASDIVAIDVVPERLELALELGATRVVRGKDPLADEKVVGDGPGMDFALDTTARSAVMETALGTLRIGGELVLVGASADALSVHPTQLTGKKVGYVLEGAADPHELIPRLIAHWKAGEFPFDRLIETFPFESVNDAEEATHSGRVVKPVLTFASE